MKRALLLVLDSVGIGGAPDAENYGDAGADTLGRIYEAVEGFSLPTLERLGLKVLMGKGSAAPEAVCARLREQSVGKDTTTGHWELAGEVLKKPFNVYDKIPDELVNLIEEQNDLEFIGNYAQSGTKILEELGEEHCRTGAPILYTSADSVLQIAAHEDVIPWPKLHEICQIAREQANDWNIGRVIARPFTGTAGNFRRTAGRHDYAMIPPPTVLNAIRDAGFAVQGVGKISDIFAGEGVSVSHPTSDNAMGMQAIDKLWPRSSVASGAEPETGLIFANLVDFDMLFGHRRDISGYANALVEFDRWLAEFLPKIAPIDLVIITADHGNDPGWKGTDHTREEVPVFVLHGGQTGMLPPVRYFSDVAATLAEYFGLKWPTGNSLCTFQP